MLKSASVSVASLARPGQLGHLGEVCCYGTGRHGTDANEPTRAHARLRNLSWMTYSPCDDHGHNKGDEPSFPLNGKHRVKRFNCWCVLCVVKTLTGGRLYYGPCSGRLVMTCYYVMTYVQEPSAARPQLRQPTATARWPSVSAGQRTMGPFEHG